MGDESLFIKKILYTYGVHNFLRRFSLYADGVSWNPTNLLKSGKMVQFLSSVQVDFRKIRLLWKEGKVKGEGRTVE